MSSREVVAEQALRCRLSWDSWLVSTNLCCKNNTLIVVSLGFWASEAVVTSEGWVILVSRAVTDKTRYTKSIGHWHRRQREKSEIYSWPTKKGKRPHLISSYLSSEAASSSHVGSGETCVLNLSKIWLQDLIRVPSVPTSSTSPSLETFGTMNCFQFQQYSVIIGHDLSLYQ